MEQLRDVFHQMKHDFLPQCTYCVNSGHGLHLYYLFEKPVPLYRHLQDQLREFKYELIRKIWNRYTSTYTEREQVQYQGIFQGFRMVGTQSKLGKRYPVTAFETGERVTVEYLNDFLMDDSKAVTDFKYKSDLSLTEAKKKYPEWYEKRIVRARKRAGGISRGICMTGGLGRYRAERCQLGIDTGVCLCLHPMVLSAIFQKMRY